MKILLYTIDSRLSASARHGRAGSFLNFIHRSAAQEAPSGAAAIIVSEGASGSNPRIISEYYDFHGNSYCHDMKYKVLVRCMREQCLSPHSAPAHSDNDVLPVLDLSYLGETTAGGESP